MLIFLRLVSQLSQVGRRKETQHFHPNLLQSHNSALIFRVDHCEMIPQLVRTVSRIMRTCSTNRNIFRQQQRLLALTNQPLEQWDAATITPSATSQHSVLFCNIPLVDLHPAFQHEDLNQPELNRSIRPGNSGVS